MASVGYFVLLRREGLNVHNTRTLAACPISSAVLRVLDEGTIDATRSACRWHVRRGLCVDSRRMIWSSLKSSVMDSVRCEMTSFSSPALTLKLSVQHQAARAL